MPALSITRALAEIALQKEQIVREINFVKEHVSLPANRIDPLANDGGSQKVLQSKMQSIRDKADYVGRLRRAIAHSNAETTVEVDYITKTVEEWLIWKRDIYPLLLQATSSVSTTLTRSQLSKEEVINFLSPDEAFENLRELQNIYNRLDAALSESNAVTKVNV